MKTKHMPRKYRAKSGKRAQCRAITTTGIYCRNSASIKTDYLCGIHTKSTNNRCNVHEYTKILKESKEAAIIGNRLEKLQRIESGFASMSYEALQKQKG